MYNFSIFFENYRIERQRPCFLSPSSEAYQYRTFGHENAIFSKEMNNGDDLNLHSMTKLLSWLCYCLYLVCIGGLTRLKSSVCAGNKFPAHFCLLFKGSAQLPKFFATQTHILVAAVQVIAIFRVFYIP